jgi:putative heme transporter
MSPATQKPRRLTTCLASMAAIGFGGGLMAALPRFVGVSWHAIGADVASVPLPLLGGLLLLWFAGLVVHLPVLMAAMPGLGARQALRLNLSGSAISNLVPVGGPAGMGLGYAMARSWGFKREAFTCYTVTTNLWNSVGKFTVGLVVLAVASLLDVGLPSALGVIVLSATTFMAVAAGVVVMTFRTERTTVRAGGLLDRLHQALRPHTASDTWSVWLLASRRELGTCVRRGWKVMTAGVLTYLAMQAGLLLACLSAVGAGASVWVVAIAFAIERLISLAPITPGATGMAELGTVAALHSFGVDPVSAAAGVVLYRTLMFAVEIPIGGALTLQWLRGRQRQHSIEPTEPLPGPSAGAVSSGSATTLMSTTAA